MENAAGDSKRQKVKGADQRRIEQLAQPKQAKTIWLTEFGPRVLWGTQDQLWPVKRSSLSVHASERLVQLAEPKKDFTDSERKSKPQFVYSCGRESPVWEVDGPALQAECSNRLKQLAKPKQSPPEYEENIPLFVYSCGRSSPIWSIRSLPAIAGPRLQQLAQPRGCHGDFQANRSVQTLIPQRVLRARTSTKIRNLSQPKNRPAGPFRDPEWPVSTGSRQASASDRCLELAHAKRLPDSYLANRTHPQWPVTRGALRARPTGRLETLATPIKRATMDHLQFDPEAFNVKPAALKAICSNRTNDLALPLVR